VLNCTAGLHIAIVIIFIITVVVVAVGTAIAEEVVVEIA
jgi:hypothetical protein